VNSHPSEQPSVLIVGGGFAGVGCAHELAKHDVRVTLFDRNNYHQFQPLLYQVATGELAPEDVARPLRGIFADDHDVDVQQVEVTAVDPATRTVTTADGRSFTGDYLVVAAGSRPNFYGVPGADEHAFPLYSVADARALRNRIFEVFEEADANPERIDQGALNFVVIGAGPTGVETAGALGDLINDVMVKRCHAIDVRRSRVYLVDHGKFVLAPFSDKAHVYAAHRLEHGGVTLLMETGVTEIRRDGVTLSDGTTITSRTVVWAGGVQASALAAASGAAVGRGGRYTTQPDLTLADHPNVYAVGDVANIADHDGNDLPQLGSVALQAGRWAAENIVRDIAGKDRKPFKYRDKGIMAMVGRGAAVAELGADHHELRGHAAFLAWLGIHAWLMSGVHQRVDAFTAWAWDFLGSSRSAAVIDDLDAARIDWDDDPDTERPQITT
jgi:NADH dehydrogenase